MLFEIGYYKISKRGEILVDETPVNRVEFVFLLYKFKRAYFGNFDLDEGLFCASDDGQVPNRGKNQLKGPCKTCVMAQWNGKTPPACTEIYDLICFDTERKQPFSFSIKRASIKPFKKFLSNAALQFDAQIDDIPVEQCLVGEITVREAKKDKKEYFAPQFNITRHCSAKEAHHYAKVKQTIERFMTEEARMRQKMLPSAQETAPEEPPDTEESAMAEVNTSFPYPDDDECPFA